MSITQRNELRVAEEAARWLATLEGGRETERAAFAVWLKESPRHVQEFLLATSLDQELERFDGDQNLDVNALLQQAGDNVCEFPPATPTQPTLRPPATARRSRRWLAVASIAAVLTTAALLAWKWTPWSLSAPTFSTAVGEQRTFDLADGSVVYLNTHSYIRVKYSTSGRDIELLAGEALFKVRHEVARPFRVHAQSTVIQALGTEFDVQRGDDQTTVAVLEGRVQISPQAEINTGATDLPPPTGAPVSGASKPDNPLHLAAGESVHISRGGRILDKTPADLERTMAWRQRRLIFRSDPLSQIAEEFNRYNRTPQVRVEDSAVASLRFSGVFDADDPESLAQVLAGNPSVTVEHGDGAILIHGRP